MIPAEKQRHIKISSHYVLFFSRIFCLHRLCSFDVRVSLSEVTAHFCMTQSCISCSSSCIVKPCVKTPLVKPRTQSHFTVIILQCIFIYVLFFTDCFCSRPLWHCILKVNYECMCAKEALWCVFCLFVSVCAHLFGFDLLLCLIECVSLIFTRLVCFCKHNHKIHKQLLNSIHFTDVMSP